MVGFRLCYFQGPKCWEMGLAVFPLLCDGCDDGWLNLGRLTLGAELNEEKGA